MNQKLKVVFLSFLFFCGLTIYAQVATIKGKILTAEGKPQPDAIIGIVNLSAPISDVVKSNPDGSYEIKVTRKGPYTIEFNAPYHNPAWVPLYNNGDRTLTIDINMKYYTYNDPLGEVTIKGNFGEGEEISPEIPMIPEQDGTYSYEVKTDKKEVKYKIGGAVNGRPPVNGTQWTRLEPDYYGDYFSVIPVTNGVAKIIFDPAKVVKGGADQQVVIRGSKFDEKFYELSGIYFHKFEELKQQLNKWQAEKKNRADFVFDSGNFIPELAAYIESEKDAVLLKLAKLSYISYSQVKAIDYSMEKAAKWYESIPASDPDWEINMEAYNCHRFLFNKEKADEIEQKFLNGSKNIRIIRNFIVNKLSAAKMAGNKEELTKLHDLIKTKYADDKILPQYLRLFPIEAAVAIGKQIPDFEAASLDNPSEKFSKKSMLGKIYMIDFWATWCGPCVGEMASIHKAYNKFKDKGFEIVSLSVDQGVNEIVKFRKDKFPMPWKNAFINNAVGSKITTEFGVIGIPMPILVSGTGEVLALNEALRGEKLEETLAKYFGGENK